MAANLILNFRLLREKRHEFLLECDQFLLRGRKEGGIGKTELIDTHVDN